LAQAPGKSKSFVARRASLVQAFVGMGKTCHQNVVWSHYWGYKEEALERPWLWVLAPARHQKSEPLALNLEIPCPTEGDARGDQVGDKPLVPPAAHEAEAPSEPTASVPQVPVQPEYIPGETSSMSPVVSRPHTYRVRGAGFRGLDMEAEATETVAAFCARLGRTLRPEADPGTVHVHLSHRDTASGGMVELDEDEHEILICSLVPDRSALTAKISGGVVQSGAAGAPASAEELRALHALQTEGKMLHWERSRLARELRGLRVLLEKMKGHSPSDQEALPSSDAPLWEVADVGRLRNQNDAMRIENARLARELSGMEALVCRLSSRTESPGGPPDGQQRNWRGEVVQGVVHRMPPDGACLFHSLAHGLGLASAGVLRQEICDFIEFNPDATMSGNTVRNWVLWESGQLPEHYAAAMRTSDKWGGPIEMAVCSLIKKVHVHVYLEVDDAGFQRICAFDESGNSATKVVSVAFTPGHYDAFEVQREA